MALGPIDYSGMQQYNDLIGNIQSGAQFGLGLQQVAEQRRQQEQARMAQQQYQTDVAAYLQNPTAEGAASLVTKYPQQREAILGGWKALDENRQRDELQVTNQVYSALSSDRPDIAQKVLEDRIAARQNSGLPVAKEQGALELVKTNPAQAKGYLGLVLAQLDDNFAKNFATLGAERRAEDKAPAELLEANSKAASAATAAKFAESKAVMDLKLSQSQIEKMAADTQIAKENARIAAINAATAREGNSLKKQELQLKLQEAITARDEKLRTKVAEVESARSAIDNTLNTIDKLFQNTAWKDVVGSFEGRMPEAASALDDNESDAIALINTIGSQVFLSAVKQAGSMTGLTEKEGEKLQNSLAAMGRAQSEKSFEANGREAQRLLMKGRKNIALKYGVKDDIPDTPAANPSASEVDDLVRRYTGSGR